MIYCTYCVCLYTYTYIILFIIVEGNNLVLFFQPHAPIVSRAAFLLECAHFVHSCNKGQWPSWLKHNLPLFRPSGPPPSSRPNPNSARRTHLLQRTAGNIFYQWAEVCLQ